MEKGRQMFFLELLCCFWKQDRATAKKTKKTGERKKSRRKVGERSEKGQRKVANSLRHSFVVLIIKTETQDKKTNRKEEKSEKGRRRVGERSETA